MKSFLVFLQSNRALTILLIVFVALAFFYSAIIPIFEGPDEDDHFRYAKFIADHRAFPVQEFVAGGGAAGHQGWQPPLYYSLAALVIAPIDTSDYEQQLWRNYAATFLGDPACCGRNIYYHPDAQNFPWTRTVLAVHLARLLSIVFGAITVAATFFIARTLASVLNLGFGLWSLGFSLAVASIVAFNPSFLFASALVSNDAPLAAFCALVLLVWVKLLTGQIALSVKSTAMIGALIGLAILIKTTAIGLIPFTLFVFVVIAFRNKSIRLFVASSLVCLGLLLFVDLGWFARNTILYGDPLAYRLMLASAIFPRSGPLTPAELFQISLPWLWQTFWGGPTPGDFSGVILAALALLMLVALGGILVFAIRNSKFEIRSLLFVLGAWLAFILVAQIQFIQTTTGADQGRYLFPAISIIALFIVIGVNEIVSRITHHASRFTFPILVAAFFLLALFVPFAYTLPAYARPALLSESDAQKIAHPIQTTFAGQMQLLGYDLKSRAVKPGETLPIDLYWRALAPMNESYRVFVHLVGQDNYFGGGVDVIPARGAFPAVYWKPGDTLRDTVQIPVDANAMPGKYAIEIGLYPVGKPSERLSTASDDDRVLIDGVKIAPREKIAANPQHRIGATLGEQIELVGYDAVIDEKIVRLKLYWRARATVAIDYKVFVHLVDANNVIADQADEFPQAGNYPTSIWDKDEIIVDAYALTLPRPGDYRIEIGMYRADSGERLPVSSGGDSIVWKLAQ